MKGRPARTCVACRQSGGRGELLRLVMGPEGQIALDPRVRSGGRGAWIHPARRCVVTAAKRHAAERSLKVSAQEIDADALVTQIKSAFERRIRSLMIVANRARALAVGALAAGEVLEQGQAKIVLVASDAGESSRAVAKTYGVPVRTLGPRAELGEVFGRAEVAVLAVTDVGIAGELLSTMDRLAGVEG